MTIATQITLIIELIGTEGVLDEPESDYKVMYADEAVERVKQIVLNEVKQHPDFGWSIIKGVK